MKAVFWEKKNPYRNDAMKPNGRYNSTAPPGLWLGLREVLHLVPINTHRWTPASTESH